MPPRAADADVEKWRYSAKRRSRVTRQTQDSLQNCLLNTFLKKTYEVKE
jgi:isochorismate hydrolase